MTHRRNFTVLHPFRSWQTAYLSIFSRAVYQDVGRRWQGSGLGYLFLLLCVTTIPLTFQVARLIDEVKETYIRHVVEKLPALRIEHGILKADVVQPFVITLPGQETPFLVIDTRQSPASEAEFEAPVVLQADRMIVDNQGEVRSYPFETIEAFELDKGQLYAWVDKVIAIVKPVAYLPLLAGEFIYRALQAVIYAVGGMVFAAWLKVRLPYGVLLRLSCVALTPGILLGTLLAWLGISFGLLGMLLFLITQGYLFFAIQSLAQDQDGTPPDDILEV
jgi:hypothetical protein